MRPAWDLLSQMGVEEEELWQGSIDMLALMYALAFHQFPLGASWMFPLFLRVTHMGNITEPSSNKEFFVVAIAFSPVERFVQQKGLQQGLYRVSPSQPIQQVCNATA